MFCRYLRKLSKKGMKDDADGNSLNSDTGNLPQGNCMNMSQENSIDTSDQCSQRSSHGSDTDSTDNEEVKVKCLNVEHSAKKKKQYERKYKTEWSHKFSFIEEKHQHIFCVICNKQLVGSEYHIKRHEKSTYHVKRFKAKKMSLKLDKSFKVDTVRKFDKDLKSAELKLTAFLAEHNLPFLLMDHLPLLSASAFPDSHIAKKLKIKRKKSTQLTIGVLGPAAKLEVVKFIRENPFSLIVDESTDISLKKCFAILVRYFKGNKVHDSLLDFIEVEAATAEGLYQCIKKVLDENNIPYNKLVGIAADNANVMLGQVNSVQVLLKRNINPKIIVMGCTCHSFHLCSSYACKQLPEHLENFVHSVCNYFSKSTKRCENLREFQDFVQETPSKILRICKTRWLSLGMVCNRILDHWNSLNLFFQNEVLNEKVLSAQEILNNFNNKITKCYMLFLKYILDIVNKLNLEFQSETPKVTLLLERVTNLYKIILRSFIKKTVLDKYKNNVELINVNDPSIFLELNVMYFGAHLELFLSDNQINSSELQSFKRRSLDFYVELCKQIRSRFDFKNETLQFASLFEPSAVVSRNVISIAQAANIFFDLKVDLEQLNIEWHLAGEIGTPFEVLNVDNFWGSLFKQKNSLDEPLFPNLMNVVSRILALPHSSAAAERLFSQMKLIKVPTRNKLAVRTVCSILHTKELLKNTTCYNFQPSNNMLNFNNTIDEIKILDNEVRLN
jgi:hypothetical protein